MASAISHHVKSEHVSNFNHFWEKVKNHKKLSKIMPFQKILNSVTSNFSAFLEVQICTCPTSFYNYSVKSPRSLIFCQFFRKSQLRMVFLRRTTDIPNFFYVKKRNFLNCDFWPRKRSKWPNFVPGAIKNMFWAQTKNLKFFDFWT